jgi:hypothetical protein
MAQSPVARVIHTMILPRAFSITRRYITDRIC